MFEIEWVRLLGWFGLGFGSGDGIVAIIILFFALCRGLIILGWFWDTEVFWTKGPWEKSCDISCKGNGTVGRNANDGLVVIWVHKFAKDLSAHPAASPTVASCDDNCIEGTIALGGSGDHGRAFGTNGKAI